MARQLLRPLVGGLLAAACGAALADAADDALVFRAITLRAAEAACSSRRAIDALGGGEEGRPLDVSPWWRGAVSAPLWWGGRRGGGVRSGSVASASFTVTGPPESGSRVADVVVLAVAAAREKKQKREKEEEEEKEEVASTPSTSSSTPSPPPSSPSRPLLSRSLSVLLRSLSRRWSPEGWTLVSADITLPRPGGLPGPATGVSLMEEVEKLMNERENEEKKEEKKKKK